MISGGVGTGLKGQGSRGAILAGGRQAGDHAPRWRLDGTAVERWPRAQSRESRAIRCGARPPRLQGPTRQNIADKRSDEAAGPTPPSSYAATRRPETSAGRMRLHGRVAAGRPAPTTDERRHVTAVKPDAAVSLIALIVAPDQPPVWVGPTSSRSGGRGHPPGSADPFLAALTRASGSLSFSGRGGRWSQATVQAAHGAPSTGRRSAVAPPRPDLVLDHLDGVHQMKQPKPWYRRFAADVLEGTAEMTLAEQGLYNRLLDHQWCRPSGRLPLDHFRLAVLLGITQDQFDSLWPAVAPKFTKDEDGYYNERLELERIRAERVGAERRKAGRKGGRTRARNQQATRDPEGDSTSPVKANAKQDPGKSQAIASALLKQNHSNPTRAVARDARLDRSTSSSSSQGVDGGVGEEGGAPPDFDEVERQVLEYLNDLSGSAYGVGADTEYLRERFEEGRSFDDCCRVVEAAVASDKLDDAHPRKIFSHRWFGSLLTLRLDTTRWAKVAPRFDEALARYEAREAARAVVS